MVPLTPDQAWAARYAVRDLIALRNAGGRAIPNEVIKLAGYLESCFAGEIQSDCTAEESDAEDLIGAAEAASILNCSPQWVRKIHSDLDGERIGRTWVFRRQTVVDYADAKGTGSERTRTPPTRRGGISSGAA